MKYLSRFSWMHIARKTYRSYDGRFKIYLDMNMPDYGKLAWVLYDVIYGNYYSYISFKESRKAAQDIYNLDVKEGRITESFP